jgi:hypothetical protein
MTLCFALKKEPFTDRSQTDPAGITPDCSGSSTTCKGWAIRHFFRKKGAKELLGVR